MTTYLLDSSVVSSFFLGRSPLRDVADTLVNERSAATRILIIGEVIEYVVGRGDAASQIANLDLLVTVCPALPVTRDIVERYALLRRRLRPPHGPGVIGDIDTLIAATALAHNLTVVITDRHLVRVPDLKLLLVPRR